MYRNMWLCRGNINRCSRLFPSFPIYPLSHLPLSPLFSSPLSFFSTKSYYTPNEKELADRLEAVQAAKQAHQARREQIAKLQAALDSHAHYIRLPWYRRRLLRLKQDYLNTAAVMAVLACAIASFYVVSYKHRTTIEINSLRVCSYSRLSCALSLYLAIFLLYI